jgi:hypothetical protein
MKMNKAALALAIASSFGAMSGAQAAITLGTSTEALDTVLKIANEISLQNVGPFLNDADHATTPNRLVVKVPAIKGYSTNANNRYFVKVALLNGATFNGEAQMKCAVAAEDDTILERTQNGTEDESIATFSLATDKKLASDVDTCSLFVQGDKTTVAGMTGYYNITDRTDQRMSAVIEFQDGLTNKTTATVATFIDFVTALAVSASTKSMIGPAANAVISVQDASLKFTTTTLPNTTNAFVGSVSYGKDAGLEGAKVYGSHTAIEVNAGLILESASITVNSPALAGIDTVNLVEKGATKPCDGLNKGAVKPNGSTSVTFSGINAAVLEAGLDICIATDSVTAIPAGQFSVTVTGTGKTGMEPNFGTANRTLYDLKKNGSSYRALNIPPAGVADKAFIRLYNVSGFTGTVLGTMRDASGATIGTASTVVTTLGPREVKVVNAETLKTLFGDWTGRSRLFLEADIDNLRVQSLLRSSDVLENMSSQAKD